MRPMKLTVQDRVVLLTLLPKEGDVLTMKIINDLRHNPLKLGFDAVEHEKFKLQEKGDQIQWDLAAAKGGEKLVTFGAAEEEVFARVLVNLDKQGKLREEHLPWYDRFAARPV